MKIFLVRYHDADSVPFSSYLIAPSKDSARRYVEKHFGTFLTASDVTAGFKFDYDDIRECLSLSYPSDAIDVIMSLLIRGNLFDLT